MARTDLYLNHSKLEEFKSKIGAGDDFVLEELWNSPKALLITLAQQMTGKHVVILSGDLRESKLFDDLAYFGETTPLEFPAWETLPSEEIPPSPDVVGERYHILREIQESQKPQVIFTTLQAVLQKLLPPKKLKNMHLILKSNTEVPFEELPHVLAEMGYHRCTVAADKGEFAVRGGIIDLYPVNSPDPFRIEFWDDEIASIRKYDPISQTSVEKVEQIVVTPGEELELLTASEELATLFDYLDKNTLVIFDEVAKLEDKYVALKQMMGSTSRTFSSFEQLLEKLAPLQKIYFSETPLEQISEVQLLDRASLKTQFEAFSQTFIAHRWRHPFLPVFASFCPPGHLLEEFSADDLFEMLCQTPDLSVQFICQNESEKNSLLPRIESLNAAVEKGYLSSGFYLMQPSFALIPMTEITHRYKVRRQKQRTHYHTPSHEVLSPTPGEAVVHMNNGIGRYIGIERRQNHLGVETEFMLLEYAQGGRLYVPMEQANLVSKYIGSSEIKPELHTLGTSRWKKARERTEKAIVGYASDLLKLQAQRVVKGGFNYPENSDLVTQFGEEFPYQETPDQMLAINHIQKDMCSDLSMDRLICGDVGYGKTEVAMRAAFKAVVDGGKQVAILVPTTVLAMQHYETFSARMANYPLKVGVLSRFIKPKESKRTLEELEQGSVDIVVGTHRLVSKDVQFKNLGLVIIDEEQRFGVRAKEHLKKIRSEVDCLTLTATPIPRTLYMSLVGARSLSVINTPPEDRLPIQSVVCTYSEDLIKNTLLRELARDGQVYFIHNRVDSIFQAADKLQQLIPTARIVVGHGQMSASELDSVFHAFKSGQADILVATSIIENGIDIPNANTILIDRSDRFGLAELYQMRGRVGRWNRKAYCYFLVPSTRELSEISRKRLSALTQSAGHGGGMKIAMHDLEIRGAGNILGTEQSGHVAAIGFQLYCKLLKKTVSALQKKETPLFYHEVKIDFPYDARLPDEYVNEPNLRMEMYQRLGDCESATAIDELIAEIKDRFGTAPPQVAWLHAIGRVRLFAAQNQFSLLKLTKVVLYAEQMHGKNKISKKILVKVPQKPEELEPIVLEALKANFPLKS
ncbi:MAG: Transcription-repair-coupling factor [Chlamydiales bacterium]|nr:Transcription-repair-coupling factor [Chlamydiales bacterium]